MSTTPMTQEELDAIRERVDAVGTIQPARYGTAPYEVYDSAEYENGEMGDYVTHGSPREVDAEFIAHAYTDVPALLAEVERLRALTTVDDDMVERAVEAHRETFNAWPVKRNLEDADNRRVAAMRAALDAALGTGEGS